MITWVFLFAAAAGGLVVLEAVIRRSDVAAILALGLMLVLEIGVWSLNVNAGSIRVGPNDLLVVVLLTAAIARLLRADRLTPGQRLLMVFGVLVAWGIVRGTGLYGAPATLNEARKFLVFVATALYFATTELSPELRDRIARTWLAVAVALCVLTVLRWTDIAGFSQGSNLRVIPAAATLFVAQGALIAFPLVTDRSRPLLRFLAPVLLVFVVLLQHRTVWVITAAGVLYLLFRERAIASRILGVLAVAVVMFAGLVFTVFAESDDEITDQLGRSAQSTATFEWRVDGWRALLMESSDEALEVITGQPFGAGWARPMPNGRVVEVSPHSFYVEPYLRVGLTGLVAMLLAYGLALRRTASAARHELGAQDHAAPMLLGPNVLHTTIAVQLLFFVTYTPHVAQALLLGLGLGVAAQPYRPGTREPTRIEAHA